MQQCCIEPRHGEVALLDQHHNLGAPEDQHLCAPGDERGGDAPVGPPTRLNPRTAIAAPIGSAMWSGGIAARLGSRATLCIVLV